MASTSTKSPSTHEAPATYSYPYNVNVANFVSGHDKYSLWRTQMLCLIEGHDMLGFIDGTLEPPPETKPEKYQWWWRSDALIQGWILGSLTEDVLTSTIGLETAAASIWINFCGERKVY
ncbi:hypothetical protein L1987_07337 [Smallanthus sonchifolius]|uniref:Uncharacterized protein n=1 Tax=Smallanthus sonchifolius TaxID=185202 RepID=A0ACB9K0I8_9ASTR|nr:hypothetical protein L1987_07337 [Smallanthus sonchifolius]